MPYKPIVFISYAHADEEWLAFVRAALSPGEREGIFAVWVDREMMGGEDWGPEIEQKLRECDIFILLVSNHSMASRYILEKELPIIRERLPRKDGIYFYPLLLTPTAKAGLNNVDDKNLRPRDAKPFSNFPPEERLRHMTEAADEIETIARRAPARQVGLASDPSSAPIAVPPAYVNISGLPETAYQRLVGRDAELKRLDEAWADRKVNILSLVAEGGAGKSALVNDWLRRLQAEDYRSAEIVLGWSFYSQGTKERATSAELFLDWALEKLSIKLATTSASAKGEAIAEAMMRRRALLLLDGVEPLQHGPGPQKGQLKDQGLRALLRRFAATPPGQAHGLIVVTSRLAVADIAGPRWGAALVVDVEKLSDEAGAALLSDNGVRGTDKELKTAAHEFGGHPLALGLLASFLRETQQGDVRRRHHIRAVLADGDNPGHDHAARVMESYEREWLAGRPVLLVIMYIVGLFDRPASGDCLAALRAEPAIVGLTDAIVGVDDSEWRRAVGRLRDAHLVAPIDPTAPDALDAHPLVREWFGERLRQANATGWIAAHGRLYEHLRDTTEEGYAPTLSDFAPLYQAIAHGCYACRHQEVLDEIYITRICRNDPSNPRKFFASRTLGACGTNLAAVSWFFATLFNRPVPGVREDSACWLVNEAAYLLLTQSRLEEALTTQRSGLKLGTINKDELNLTVGILTLSKIELTVGEICPAITTASDVVSLSDKIGDDGFSILSRSNRASALHAAGRRDEAERLFGDAERLQKILRPNYPQLYAVHGYQYNDVLLDRRYWNGVRDRVTKSNEFV